MYFRTADGFLKSPYLYGLLPHHKLTTVSVPRPAAFVRPLPGFAGRSRNDLQNSFSRSTNNWP